MAALEGIHKDKAVAVVVVAGFPQVKPEQQTLSDKKGLDSCTQTKQIISSDKPGLPPWSRELLSSNRATVSVCIPQTYITQGLSIIQSFKNDHLKPRFDATDELWVDCNTDFVFQKGVYLDARMSHMGFTHVPPILEPTVAFCFNTIRQSEYAPLIVQRSWITEI